METMWLGLNVRATVATVSLVSHDPSFFCGGRTVELNPSIESY